MWWRKKTNISFCQDILRDEPIDKVMIFANRRDQVPVGYDHLKRDGYKGWDLSGEIAQDKRLKMLDQFKQNQAQHYDYEKPMWRVIGIHVDGVSWS